MSNLNQFTGQGNLTDDPKVYNADDDDRRVVRFTVAINNGFGDRKSTTFMNCVGFGKQAGVIASHLTKGKQVIVRGMIVPNVYEPEEGTKRITLELELERVNGFFFTGNAPAKTEEPAVVTEELAEAEAAVSVAGEAGVDGDGKLL